MSSDRRLFRDEACERRGQREPIDGLLRVTAPHEWAILLGLLVALLGVLTWGLLGSIERTVEADCVLVRPGDRHAVLSDGSGDVVDIFVNEGDSIDVGQPIASLRAPDLHRQIEIARARVEALEAANNSDSDALALAQAELAVLEKIQAAGESIISPFTGEITYLALVPGQSVEAGAEVVTVLAGD